MTTSQLPDIRSFRVGLFVFFYTQQIKSESEEQQEKNGVGQAALLGFHHCLLVVIRVLELFSSDYTFVTILAYLKYPHCHLMSRNQY